MKLLENKTILVTKKKESAEKYFFPLIEEEAKIIYFPTIKVIPIDVTIELSRLLNRLAEFDYIIFTSSNAVEAFTNIAKGFKLDLTRIKIAAVGKRTADACKSFGLKTDIIPLEFNSSGLIKIFSGIDLNKKKIFIPCSSLSNDELKNKLTELGADVFSIPVYDVVTNDLSNLINEKEEILIKQPDIFIFTSPSSFNNFINLMNIVDAEEYFNKKIICSIGSTTEKAINERGIVVHIVPNEFSLSGISNAIIKYFQITVNIV